ncbi:MAG: hypothetical protein FWF07_04645 [Methanomassiliicoccaceae archaeon]|nr:hypothetical protein [Methanomassiliicoccaceae archaeon]
MAHEETSASEIGYTGSPKSEETENFATYAIIMLKLQELCGMTYKEARAYLMAYEETPENFAEDLGINIRSVRKIYQRAALKMESSGFTLYNIMERYGKLPFVDF